MSNKSTNFCDCGHPNCTQCKTDSVHNAEKQVLREQLQSVTKLLEESKAREYRDVYQLVPKVLTKKIAEAMKSCEEGEYTMEEAWNLILQSAVEV